MTRLQRKRGRPGLAGMLALLLVGAFGSVPPASAATIAVGQLFAPDTTCLNDNTRLQVSADSGTPYTIPSAGVLTSWRYRAGTQPLVGLKFKVAQSVGANTYKIVAQTVAGPQVAGTVNKTPARIPVKGGQLIGIYYVSGQCEVGSGPPGDVYAKLLGDQLVGSSAAYSPSAGGRIPVQALVESDADHDGFGDSSQDKCVGRRGTKAGCPVARCKKKKGGRRSAQSAKRRCKKKGKKG